MNVWINLATLFILLLYAELILCENCSMLQSSIFGNTFGMIAEKHSKQWHTIYDIVAVQESNSEKKWAHTGKLISKCPSTQGDVKGYAKVEAGSNSDVFFGETRSWLPSKAENTVIIIITDCNKQVKAVIKYQKRQFLYSSPDAERQAVGSVPCDLMVCEDYSCATPIGCVTNATRLQSKITREESLQTWQIEVRTYEEDFVQATFRYIGHSSYSASSARNGAEQKKDKEIFEVETSGSWIVEKSQPETSAANSSLAWNVLRDPEFLVLLLGSIHTRWRAMHAHRGGELRGEADVCTHALVFGSLLGGAVLITLISYALLFVFGIYLKQREIIMFSNIEVELRRRECRRKLGQGVLISPQGEDAA